MTELLEKEDEDTHPRRGSTEGQVVDQFLENLDQQADQPSLSAPEVAREFTEAILEAAQSVLPA